MWLCPWCVLAALVFEACIGYPSFLPHPVVAIGKLIALLDQRLNREHYPFARRRILGLIAMIGLIAGSALLGWLIQKAAGTAIMGKIVIAVLASVGLAQHSLYVHVRAVLKPLQRDDLNEARHAVAQIVGRDTAALDSSQIAAAAIESLAESFNDGIVAPAFWLFFGGLPALLAYKAINTADSMIGHMDRRWRAFGWAAARIDDVANLVSARIAGVLLVLGGAGGAGSVGGAGGAGSVGGAAIMWRDAPKHASPNAGWPEAAMAGALGIRLGGLVAYDGIAHERSIIGDGAAPSAADLRRALRVYVAACAALWAVFALGGMAWPR